MTPAPLWLRLGYTAWIAVWIPAYWSYYGPSAFLWFCDLGNLQILAGLWTGRSLFYSWAAVSVLLVQLLWVGDVLGRLLTGVHWIGGTQYMWSPAIPLGIRLLSLFHAAAPPLLFWGLRRHGYDRRALPLQVATAWVVLPVCWFLTSPQKDINWVFGPFDRIQDRLPPGVYLLLCMLAYPLLLHLPTHLLLGRLFRAPPNFSSNASPPPPNGGV
jgi:hypothetical protein